MPRCANASEWVSHAADVGGLEIGVEGYGFLPVMAGLVEVVGGVVSVAKACSEPAVGCPHR